MLAFMKKRASSSDLPGAVRRPSLYAASGEEPTLQEVLQDPVIHAIIKADRIQHDDVSRMMQDAQRKLRG